MVRWSLPVPDEPWEKFSMDIVVELPECNGFDVICVVGDQLSKMQHSVTSHTTLRTLKLSELLLQNVVRLHALTQTIISNRGQQFASTFCHQESSVLGIN